MTLPNFLVIGATRSGTTSLHHYLGQHPDVFICPVNETNFFALAGDMKRLRRGTIGGIIPAVRRPART